MHTSNVVFLLFKALPSGYENAFEMGATQSLGNGVYTASLNQIRSVNKNSLASTEGIVKVFVEVSIYNIVKK